MKLFTNFISKLFWKNDKQTLLEDARVTKDELVNAISCFDIANEYFKSNKYKSKTLTDANKWFGLNLEKRRGMNKQVTFFGDISLRMSNMLSHIDYLHTEIDKSFDSVILSDGLTVKQGMLFRALSSISWASKYSFDLLNYLYSEEEISLSPESDKFVDLPPATIKSVQGSIDRFINVLNTYGGDVGEFKDKIKKAPEVIVNKDTVDNLTKVYDESELDHLSGSTVMGFYGSPIYLIRMAVATWQVHRHNARKEKKKQLELRLLHIKALHERTNDPKLEKEIAYTQDRINSLDKKIRDEEQSV